MNTLKKLLLASAIAALSASSFAMEAMDESALSDTVAQQGLDIFASLNISGATLTYTDADGIAGTTPLYTAGGELKVNNLGVTGDMTITVDVGGNNAATTPTTDAALFLGVTGTTALTLKLDSVTVNKVGSATNFNILTMPAATTITVASGYKLNLELGKGPSGHLGVLTGNLGTITVGTTGTAQTVAVVDGGSGTGAGTLGVSTLVLSGVDLGSGGANNTSIDVCNGTVGTGASTCVASATDVGLKIKFNGTAMAAVGLTLNDIRLGSSTAPIMGKVALTGLNLSGTSIRIAGH